MTFQTMASGYALMGKRLEGRKSGLANLPTQRIWASSDYGLKTRCWEEVVTFLMTMVAVVQQVQEEINAATC